MSFGEHLSCWIKRSCFSGWLILVLLINAGNKLGLNALQVVLNEQLFQMHKCKGCLFLCRWASQSVSDFYFLYSIFCVSLIMYLPIKPQVTVFPAELHQCNSFIFHHILMWKWTQDGRKSDAYCDMQTGHIERKSNSFKSFFNHKHVTFSTFFFTVYYVHFLFPALFKRKALYWHQWFHLRTFSLQVQNKRKFAEN